MIFETEIEVDHPNNVSDQRVLDYLRDYISGQTMGWPEIKMKTIDDNIYFKDCQKTC